MHDLTHHKLDYCCLAVATSGFIIYFLSHQASPAMLFSATLIFSIFYFFWGLAHHLREHSFRSGVMLEYFLVSLFALVVVSTLLI